MLAVITLVIAVEIFISTHARAKTLGYYLLLIILGSTFFGAILRVLGLLLEPSLTLSPLAYGPNQLQKVLFASGILLQNLTWFLRPLFFRSLYTRVHVNQVYLLLTVGCCVIGASVWAGAPELNLYTQLLSASGAVLVTSWCLFEVIRARKYHRDNSFRSIFIFILWFDIFINCVAIFFFIFANSEISTEYLSYADYSVRLYRSMSNLCLLLFVAMFWYRNFSRQAVAVQVAQDKINDLLIEKDLLIQNLINASALVHTGALSAGLAHEIRQFLARIQLDVDTAKVYLSEKTDTEQISKVLSRILDANNGAAAFIVSLQKLFIRRDEQMTSCDLNELVESTAALYLDRAAKSKIRVHTRLRANISVMISASLMRQVIANLISNAIDALDLVHSTSKEITIETSLQTDTWSLRVEDNGWGIRPENAHKIFSLFSTTKTQGTGIGLWLSRFIVEQHGGTIQFDNLPQKGVVFTIEVPINPSQEVGLTPSQIAGLSSE